MLLSRFFALFFKALILNSYLQLSEQLSGRYPLDSTAI
jgi:hypothetical protein